jgi:hypothetical protein
MDSTHINAHPLMSTCEETGARTGLLEALITVKVFYECSTLQQCTETPMIPGEGRLCEGNFFMPEMNVFLNTLNK